MALRILFVERALSYEPQGIMSMSAVLKQAGHDVALVEQRQPVGVQAGQGEVVHRAQHREAVLAPQTVDEISCRTQRPPWVVAAAIGRELTARQR